MTASHDRFGHGPRCPACGGETMRREDMVQYQEGRERGGVLVSVWQCSVCHDRFEDDALARRNAFFRAASQRLRGVAEWIARQAARERDNVLGDPTRAA